MVNVKMIGTKAKIIYLAFSVVILTENNTYLDMVTIEQSPPSRNYLGINSKITGGKVRRLC